MLVTPGHTFSSQLHGGVRVEWRTPAGSHKEPPISLLSMHILHPAHLSSSHGHLREPGATNSLEPHAIPPLNLKGRTPCPVQEVDKNLNKLSMFWNTCWGGFTVRKALSDFLLRAELDLGLGETLDSWIWENASKPGFWSSCAPWWPQRLIAQSASAAFPG